MMKPKHCLFPLLFLLVFGGVSEVRAQEWAIKTNIAYDATATINLGAEIGLSKKWTLDLSGNFNAWSRNEQTKWKHWMVQPEARYWFCDRFSRHFVGTHLITGAYNLGGINTNISFLGKDFSKLQNNRYQGYAYGLGVAYGFAFMLSEHINIELEAGIGYAFFDFDVFDCGYCSRQIGSGNLHYFGPTKVAVNLVYLF